MRQLTIEQRAKRATKRINRAVAEKYPLFVEEFSTTVEEQAQRITQKDAEFQAHWAKLREHDEALSEAGMDNRDAVRLVVNDETFQSLEAKYNRIYSGRLQSGAGYADYWWQAVKKYNPAWGHDHCPNSKTHILKYSKCPTCGKVLNEG